MTQFFDRIKNEWRDCTVHSFRLMFDDDRGGSRTCPGDDIQYLKVNNSEPDVSADLPKPIFASKDGSNWVGTDFQLDPITPTFNTLKNLRAEYGAVTSHGVGEIDGDKVYQLIYEI